MDRLGGEMMAADIKKLIGLAIEKEKKIEIMDKKIQEKKRNKELCELIEIIEGIVK